MKSWVWFHGSVINIHGSSLFANALVHSPPRAPRAFPRPGWVDGTSYSMTLVSGPPVPSSEAALSALQALLRGTRGHHACTAVARVALPLRTRLDSASAIAPAVGRRYRPMNSELWQQEPDRWLLAHLLAAPSRSTRHRQGEWSRAARTSGGRACVGRTNDRTTRSSAPLHADRRAERALPLPAGGRKKCARLENLRPTNLVSGNASVH